MTAAEQHLACYVDELAAPHDVRVASARMAKTAALPSHAGHPVIVRGGRDRGAPRLLLCGHLDTVSLANSPGKLTPRIEGDRLYARGAYDMKAGLAAALIACRDAALTGIDGEVVVVAVADE